MIDIEFYENKHVRDAWKDLFAHFNAPPPGLSDEQLGQQREERYTTLLIEISKVLKYDLGRSEIRDDAYVPAFHTLVEANEMETRTRVLDLLTGDALPVRFVAQQSPPPDPPKDPTDDQPKSA